MPRSGRALLPSFISLQVVGWGGFYLLVLAASVPVLGQPGAVVGLTVWVASLAASSWCLRPLCGRWSSRRTSWLHLQALVIAWCLPLGLAVGFVPPILLPERFNWSAWLIESAQNVVVFVLWCNLYIGLRFWRAAASERERALRAESESRQARLDALRYQLNPHFLFNALNAVSTLVLDGERDDAVRMLSQISDLLRGSLDDSFATGIPLEREVGFARQYLAIEQTRLGARLSVQFAVDPETFPAIVPPLVLQPLVENAVRHGISPRVSGGTVMVAAQRADARLLVTVANSGARAQHPLTKRSRVGVGLRNCQERLAVTYGADYRLVLCWPEAGGCEVLLDVPFRTAA